VAKRNRTAPAAGAKAPAGGRITHVVLRILQGVEGGDIYAGTPEQPTYVDASGWANTALLEQTGHLRRVTLEEAEAFEKSKKADEGPQIPKSHEERVARLQELDGIIAAGNLSAEDEDAARNEAALIERAVLIDHLVALKKAAVAGDAEAQAELDQYVVQLTKAADEGDLASKATLDQLAASDGPIEEEAATVAPPATPQPRAARSAKRSSAKRSSKKGK